jgi:hypothetical protein
MIINIDAVNVACSGIVVVAEDIVCGKWNHCRSIDIQEY